MLGLIITAIFGASALNNLATNAIFNIIFFALLVLFAISFFGAFELTLPASWTTKLDSKADATTGILSISFMAFTLVLVSFSVPVLLSVRFWFRRHRLVKLPDLRSECWDLQ